MFSKFELVMSWFADSLVVYILCSRWSQLSVPRRASAIILAIICFAISTIYTVLKVKEMKENKDESRL